MTAGWEGPLVIGSRVARRPGDVFRSLDMGAEIGVVDQPHVILRPSTREAWIACVRQSFGTPPTPRELASAEGAYFYEVSVD